VPPPEDLSAAFEALAAAVERGGSAAQLQPLFDRALAVCDRTDLRTVLATWRDVWPRMGARPEFRQAVAREARLWAKRLREG
jgi:hypothetical protein